MGLRRGRCNLIKIGLFAAALLTTTVRDRVPGHTSKGAAGCASDTARVGFELETNWFQSYIIANSATMPLYIIVYVIVVK